MYIFEGVYQFYMSSLEPEDLATDIDIILLVVTRWRDFDNRKAIRQSWGKPKKKSGNGFKFKTLFVINFDTYGNIRHFLMKIRKIQNENRKFRDLIITKVEDNYKTVGLKLLSSFYWLSLLKMPSSLKWIVKLDDDVIVNVSKLEEYLSNVNIDQGSLDLNFQHFLVLGFM